MPRYRWMFQRDLISCDDVQPDAPVATPLPTSPGLIFTQADIDRATEEALATGRRQARDEAQAEVAAVLAATRMPVRQHMRLTRASNEIARQRPKTMPGRRRGMIPDHRVVQKVRSLLGKLSDRTTHYAEIEMECAEPKASGRATGRCSASVSIWDVRLWWAASGFRETAWSAQPGFQQPPSRMHPPWSRNS